MSDDFADIARRLKVIERSWRGRRVTYDDGMIEARVDFLFNELKSRAGLMEVKLHRGDDQALRDDVRKLVSNMIFDQGAIIDTIVVQSMVKNADRVDIRLGATSPYRPV